jgi:pimeloyl-ACP methyl ester carboxylesterase
MPCAKVNGINIYYEVHGSGEPLVLVPGLGSDQTRWYRNLPALAREFQVIAFDNRGAGRTDKPDEPYSMALFADDISGLLDTLGVEKTHLFGISMGGMIALNFGVRHPDRLISLIPGCTRPGGAHSVPDAEGAGALNPDLVDVLGPEERNRNLLPMLWSEEFIRDNPGVVEEYIEKTSRYPVDPVGYRRQMAAADAHDVWDRLPEIATPTLVIHGEDDRLIPSANAAVIAERIPGAELVILAGLGHGFYSERPEMVNGILVGFMKRHPAR